MTNSSKNLTTLDFQSIKDNFKTFLKSQDIFNDYDFEASNINVLLDVLAYNTNLNAFYLNMIGNEMFLDSSLLRDSVVSHAKELNYIPRSFRSAVANVNITIYDTDRSSVIIPRGTVFIGTSENKNFSFTTTENISVGGADNIFVANNVLLYEGDYTSDSYVIDYSTQQKFLIKNRTVDTNSITVTVMEDNGATVLPYTRVDSLFGLNSTDQVYFIQAAENDTYEVVFGDDVIGRKPKDNSVVIIQYRDCNGELPNGIRKFKSAGKINGTGLVTEITVNESATGGAIPESLESIKFNAPRAFTTQERVVTAKDYETLLKQNFSEINAVSAYGGEETEPPQFGKVIVAVDLKNTNILPTSKKTEYSKFIKNKSPLSIDPVFVSPDYTYIKVVSDVKYNINKTSLKKIDIESLVRNSILNYNLINLNGFNKTLYYSRFISAIDKANFSIVSNDTMVYAVKDFEPTLRTMKDYVIDFGMSLESDNQTIPETHNVNTFKVLTSNVFVFKGMDCSIEDDSNGNVRIVKQEGDFIVTVQNIGTIDYDTGIVKLTNFAPDRLKIGNAISLSASVRESDITSQRRTILDIRDTDITVNVEQVRL